MRKIFHIEIKSDNSNKYYGSLSALVNDNSDLKISKFTLDRYDFAKDYEDNFCIIRKSVMKTNSQLKDDSSN